MILWFVTVFPSESQYKITSVQKVLCSVTEEEAAADGCFIGLRLDIRPGLTANTKSMCFSSTNQGLSEMWFCRLVCHSLLKIISRFLSVHLGIETFLYAH